MGNKRPTGSLQLKRVAALPYNYRLHEEVERLQKEYGLPVIESKADVWFTNYSKAFKKSAYRLYFVRYGSPWIKELTKDMKNIDDTDVPLERDVLSLLLRFQLPEYVFFSVLRYAITSDKTWLNCYFDLKPVVRHTTEYRRIIPELEVTIYGLNPFTTGEDWMKIWNSQIKQEVDILKKDYWDVMGQSPPARKRSQLEHYREQMQRYSEWYRLSVLEGLGQSKAFTRWCAQNTSWLDKYMQDHKGEPLDESTFIKGVNNFQEIIRPV